MKGKPRKTLFLDACTTPLFSLLNKWWFHHSATKNIEGPSIVKFAIRCTQPLPRLAANSISSNMNVWCVDIFYYLQTGILKRYHRFVFL